MWGFGFSFGIGDKMSVRLGTEVAETFAGGRQDDCMTWTCRKYQKYTCGRKNMSVSDRNAFKPLSS